MAKPPLDHYRALTMAHAAIFFMGIAGVLAVASGFESWRSTAYRVLFGGIALSLFWLARRDYRLPPPRAIALFLLLGVLLSVHWFAFFKSLELLGVMLGSAMIGLEPLIVALAGALFLGEAISRRTVLAMAVSIVGFVILGMGDTTGVHLEGVAWSVFSFVLFAVLVIANRMWVQRASPLVLTSLEMLGAIPLAVMMTPAPLFPQTPNAWLFALALGLLCTGLAYALYNTSMQALTAPVAGLLLSLEVVYGILGGWLIGDSLSLRQAVAALLISNILILDLWAYGRYRRLKRIAEPAVEPLNEGDWDAPRNS